MDPVIKSLKHLQPRKGYVYETVLPLMAGYGDLCTPYARKESVPDLESIDDFERTPAFFRMMPKGYYEIWNMCPEDLFRQSSNMTGWQPERAW